MEPETEIKYTCIICRTTTANEYVKYCNFGCWMTYCRMCDDKVNQMKEKKQKPCQLFKKNMD